MFLIFPQIPGKMATDLRRLYGFFNNSVEIGDSLILLRYDTPRGHFLLEPAIWDDGVHLETRHPFEGPMPLDGGQPCVGIALFDAWLDVLLHLLQLLAAPLDVIQEWAVLGGVVRQDGAAKNAPWLRVFSWRFFVVVRVVYAVKVWSEVWHVASLYVGEATLDACVQLQTPM